MKATEVVDVADMLQGDTTRSLRRDRDIPVLAAGGGGMRDEVAVDPFIVSPTWAETCAGANLSLSMAMRIVSAEKAGAANAIAPKALSTQSLGPIGSSYFSDAATCSACISWPWKILRPVVSRSFNSGLLAFGIKTVSSAPSTVL